MNVVSQLDNIRRQNRAKILVCLREEGELSRTAIASRTGLSAATVTTITADMLTNGILLRAEDPPDSSGSRGRPRVKLSFNADFACIGVIALRLNKIYVSLVNYAGVTIHENEESINTTDIKKAQLLKKMEQSLRQALGGLEEGKNTLRHIGVCVQGTTDVAGMSMLWSPVISAINVPFSEVLGEAFDTTVSVHNDCNIIAKALRHDEPHIFNSDFAAVLLSQGIGIGLFQNGNLVQGRYSSGTEFGHMTYIPDGALCRCGRRGCIEAYAGGYGIYRQACNIDLATLPPDNIDQEEMDRILMRAREDDPQAVHSFRQAGAAIGTGLANLFALVDPFPVALVGVGAKAQDQLEESIREAIGESDMHGDKIKTEILFYQDEMPFIRHGSALTALVAVDHMVSARQIRNRQSKKA